MTPKEKAEELFDKFLNLYTGVTLGIAKRSWAKSSALIAVNEILSLLPLANRDFWEEVKQEIESF